jgi:hypothetical protein
MQTLVIYPGRFHPFHRGHRASYDYLTNKYGADTVHIATSDVQAPVTSPFSYADKVKMITSLGIPASHVVQVKNPYQAREIIDNLPDPENTVLIFAVSQKDMEGEGARFKFGVKKNGEPSYMQPLPANAKNLQPLTKHAYVEVTPTVNFKVRGADANSASQIRKMYADGNDADRDQIITDLYGEPFPSIREIFDQRLALTEKVQDLVYGTPIIDNNSMSSSASMTREHKEKMVRMLESVQRMERRVVESHQSINEDLRIDYIDEKKPRKI